MAGEGSQGGQGGDSLWWAGSRGAPFPRWPFCSGVQAMETQGSRSQGHPDMAGEGVGRGREGPLVTLPSALLPRLFGTCHQGQR